MDYETFLRNQKNWQCKWRKSQNISKEYGSYNEKSYCHIIPKEEWKKTLWGPLEKSLLEYLARNPKIEPHNGVHDLLSSWILCSNLYFGTYVDDNFKELFRQFLEKTLFVKIDKIDEIYLEFTPTGELSPKSLLGEYGEKDHTRPDLAISFITNGKKGLILVESKYTEKSFYNCSAGPCAKKAPPSRPNSNTRRCRRKETLNNLKNDCHSYNIWKRKYWDQLTVSEIGLRKFKECPACSGGFQLVRQQAFAEGIVKHGEYEKVISCIAFDGRNDALMQSIQSSGINSIREEWKELFNLKSDFSVWEHQKWVEYVRQYGETLLEKEWIEYIKNRYDM